MLWLTAVLYTDVMPSQSPWCQVQSGYGCNRVVLLRLWSVTVASVTGTPGLNFGNVTNTLRAAPSKPCSV